MSEYRIIYFLVFCTFSSRGVISSQDTLPFSSKKIPPKTPEPINIETNKAENFDTKSAPLTLDGNGGTQTMAVMLNTGYSSDTIAYTTVNGKYGRCLEVEVEYYNTAYPSFRDSWNHRDGMFKLNIRVNLNEDHNPKFDNFAKALKNVRNPGQSADLLLSDALSWILNIPPNINYKVFPGAYLDEPTRRSYFCTTTAVTELNELTQISIEQFIETFATLQNIKGEELTNSRRQHPQGDRPLANADNIVRKIDPNKKYLTSVYKKH